VKLLLAATLLCAGAAHAQSPSPLWDDVVHPNRLRCAALVELARKDLESRAGVDKLRGSGRLVEATRLCPKSVDAFALLGQARVDDGDLAGAAVALERARALAPAGEDNDPRLAFHLGFIRAIGGDLEGSLREYRRAEYLGGIGRGDEWLLLYDLGDDYMALGRLSEAIDAYRRSVRAQPSEPMPRLALGVALDRDGQLEKSRAELTVALSLDPQLKRLGSDRYVFVPAADVHYYQALAATQRGRLAEARSHFEEFLRHLPDSPYAPRAREHLRSLPP